MRLVPVILTDTIDTYRHRIELAESLTDYIQVDFMDGIFSPLVSVSPIEVAGVETNLTLEAHLMVEDPISYLRPLTGLQFVKAFFHYEAVSKHRVVINQIRDLGMKVGLAVNPDTQIGEFSGLVDGLDAVLFLAVDPRVRGSSFQAGVLGKVKQFKSSYPRIEVGVDGGINLENLESVLSAGPDFICVGSAIFNAPDPRLAFREFRKRIVSD